jgi:hypothetical protein
MLANMTSTRVFWWAAMGIMYPLLLAAFVVLAMVPLLNTILVPTWFFVCAGAVGALSNGLANASDGAERRGEEARAMRAILAVARAKEWIIVRHITAPARGPAQGT